MSPQVELMELIRREAAAGCGIEVCLDGTPADGGVSAELAPGYTDALYYDKSAIRTVPVLLIGKDKDQAGCADRLCRICNHLQRLKQYPQADGFTWLDATTATEPNKVGRQEDGQWIYSAIVNTRIHF